MQRNDTVVTISGGDEHGWVDLLFDVVERGDLDLVIEGAFVAVAVF